MNLSKQKCVPCEVGALPFSPQEIEDNLKKVTGWKLEGNHISKKFTFKDFVQSMKFVNDVAEIAEQEGHHPDISISYNEVVINLSTHSIKGLTINDFILAAKIDGIKL